VILLDAVAAGLLEGANADELVWPHFVVSVSGGA
jgi:hypothetical protein